MDSENSGNVAEEIRYWLGLSITFYEAFDRIKRHYGPLWFTINELAKETEDAKRTFGRIKNLLDDLPVFGTNSQGDLTNYLEHLRSIGYVRIQKVTVVDGANIVSDVKRTKDEKYFLSPHKILLTEQFNTSYRKYVQDACEQLFAWEAREKVKADALLVFNQIYEFARTQYLARWRGVLENLSQLATPEVGKETTDSISGKMLGSSEYFVLLLTLWASHLRNEDSEGLTTHTIIARCRHVRVLSSSTLPKIIKLLHRNGVLAEKNGRYRLADVCLPAFRKYVPDFLTRRAALKTHLTEQFPMLTNG